MCGALSWLFSGVPPRLGGPGSCQLIQMCTGLCCVPSGTQTPAQAHLQLRQKVQSHQPFVKPQRANYSEQPQDV